MLYVNIYWLFKIKIVNLSNLNERRFKFRLQLVWIIHTSTHGEFDDVNLKSNTKQIFETGKSSVWSNSLSLLHLNPTHLDDLSPLLALDNLSQMNVSGLLLQCPIYPAFEDSSRGTD